MAKAIIIFSDGSKRMAHNLDDSRLRWELRKEPGWSIEQYLDQSLPKEVAVRDCSDLSQVDQNDIDALRDELIKQKTDMQGWLAIARGKNSPYNSVKKGYLHHAYPQAKSIFNTIEAQIISVNEYIKNNGLVKYKGKFVTLEYREEQESIERAKNWEQWKSYLYSVILFLYDNLEEGTIIPDKIRTTIKLCQHKQQKKTGE